MLNTDKEVIIDLTDLGVDDNGYTAKYSGSVMVGSKEIEAVGNDRGYNVYDDITAELQYQLGLEGEFTDYLELIAELIADQKYKALTKDGKELKIIKIELNNQGITV